MTDYAFLLDLSQCIGCQACTVACKTGNELDTGQQHIHLIEQTRGEFPNLSGGHKNHRCYHCADAACVTVCPTGALVKHGTSAGEMHKNRQFLPYLSRMRGGQ